MRTEGELETMLQSENLRDEKSLEVVEVIMDNEDVTKEEMNAFRLAAHQLEPIAG